MKKIILIGKNGQLGKSFLDKYPDLILNSFGKNEVDIRKKNHLKNILDTYRPEIIINCTGFTDVNKAEIYPKEAFDVNSQALTYMSKLAKHYGSLLIHFSTDYVFDGLKKSPYFTYDLTSPLNVYGKSKLLGEKNIIKSGCNYFIIRVSWLMSVYKENFIKTILKKIKLKEDLKVVSDQIGSPTSTDLVVEITKRLIDLKTSKTNKIFHVSSKGEISWYQLCEFILDLSPVNSNFTNLQKIKSDSLNNKPMRPEYSVFSHKEIEKFLNIKLPHWKDEMRPIILKLNEENKI